MNNRRQSEEVDAIVDDLINNRVELREFISNHYERVQELENLVKCERNIAGKAQSRADKLEQQNKRYREAIEQVKDNIPLEFNHKSEIDAKKNAIRLINISHVVDKALEDSE